MDPIKRLCAAMDEGIDAALITSGPNRFYFTGMTSSAGTLFITREKAYFLIDFRYIEKARDTVKNCEVVLQDDLMGQLGELILRHQVKTVGIESRYMTISAFEGFSGGLPAEVLRDGRLQSAIDALREVKTPEEIAHLQRAQDLTDEAFRFILPYIKPGVSEQDLILELGVYMERHGSENRDINMIAISGKKTSLPHGRADTKKIESGDFVMFDMGFVIGGYHADMTRTVAVGKVSDEQRKVYATVLEAQRRALEAVRAGVPCAEVDRVARDYIDGAGYRGCFGHNLGHSVGIEVHEDPRLGPASKAVLKAGGCVTIEPGIYLAGRFGVRIEDMVIVTEDGCDDLTHSDKSLIIL